MKLLARKGAKTFGRLERARDTFASAQNSAHAPWLARLRLAE